MRHAPAVELSSDEARRAALAAQGFSGGAKRLRARRPFDAPLAALHVLQIDSVNVFARSHHLPVHSRHGAYSPEALDQELWDSGRYTEYWAHEAALLPVADRALFGWRMEGFRRKHAERAEALRPVMERIKERLAGEGPLTAGELEEEPRGGRGPWWDWSETKHAVELLFAMGEVAVAGREAFRRRYGLAERVLPPQALRGVEEDEARRALVERAARSLGVATLADLADYHRQKVTAAAPAVRSLEEEGVLEPVRVRGWTDGADRPVPAWRHRDARVPSRLAPNALLTPFDPLVWFRPRAERMFGFHYRIEIYTPAAKRRYGYYCLPLMVGGRMAGRIDLKADRPRGTLLVRAAWREPGAPTRTPEVAARLVAEAAAWQGLDDVEVGGVGDLALPTGFGVDTAAASPG